MAKKHNGGKNLTGPVNKEDISKVDFSNIISTFKINMASTLASLQDEGMCGEAGADLAGAIEPLTKLHQVFDLAGMGHMDLAYRLADGICNQFDGKLMAVAAKFKQLAIAKASVETALENMEGFQDVVLNWVVAIDTLNETFRTIKKLRSEITDMEHGVRMMHATWMSRLGSRNEKLTELLDVLSESGGFQLAVMSYFQDPASVPDMHAQVIRAQALIAEAREIEAGVRIEWQHSVDTILPKIPRFTQQVQGYCKALEGEQSTLQGFETRFRGKNLLLFGEGENLCTEEEYNCAAAILSDPENGPLTIERRLFDLIASATRLLGSRAPTLEEAVQDAITHAEASIAMLGSQMTILNAAPPTPPPPRPAPLTHSVMSQPVTPQSHDAVDPARFAELYEQIVCIGHVTTNKPRVFAQGTMHSFLHILEHLGRCTREEALLYRYQMERYVDTAEESRFVATPDSGELKPMIEAWRQTDRWLRYTVVKRKKDPDTGELTNALRRQKCTKLGLKAEKRALQLMEKHGMTAPEIEQALKMKRDHGKELSAKLKQEKAKGYRSSCPFCFLMRQGTTSTGEEDEED